MSVSAIQSPQPSETPVSQAESASELPSVFHRQSTLRADSPVEHRRLHRAIASAKAGDREAVRYLYCRYADNVYGFVCSIVRNEHDAEDLTQNVFAKLMTSIQKYEQRQVPFSAWILRVARNAALDHLRQQRSIPVAEVRSVEEPEDPRDAGDALRKALDTLSPEQRHVVLLRHVLGLSPVEIAERTGRTEASIHGLHHRGRAVLRDALTALDAAPSTISAHCSA
jgi:RNA polymerase sigma-70 factor, ECF subfamily